MVKTNSSSSLARLNTMHYTLFLKNTAVAGMVRFTWQALLSLKIPKKEVDIIAI